MKKLLIVLTMILSFGLISCDSNEKPNGPSETNLNLTEFTDLVNEFSFDEVDGEVVSDFSLPLKILSQNEEIKIDWEVIKGDNGAEIVNVNLVKIRRPDYEDEDILVTLKAKFTYKEFIEEKQFSFIVLKYEEEVIEEKDTYVVYINIDGFARYYYDLAVERGLVGNLERFREDGVFFENLRTEFPSITNPAQNMIISGATSSVTQNVYRYYDKINDIVVQQARENKADTIYQSAVRAGLTVASVRHFPSEEILSTSNLNQLYVNVPTGEVANLNSRFEQAIRLVKGETFLNGSISQKLDEVPRLLTVYVDDLDGFGHNDEAHYGKSLAKNEEGRIDNILEAVSEIDVFIKRLVDAYKERGIYDKTAFFITTDHGMTPFGHENDNLLEYLSSKYSKSKWPALRDKLKEINSEFIFEYIPAGNKPKTVTTVVGVSAGLQMALTFKEHRLSTADLEEIAREIEKEDYVYEVLTRKDLAERGIWRGANIDLLVVPSERYHFHGVNNPNTYYKVRGQHDTTQPTSRNIYGIIFGGIITPDNVINEEVSVLSFGTTMALALGINLRDANKEAFAIFIDN